MDEETMKSPETTVSGRAYDPDPGSETSNKHHTESHLRSDPLAGVREPGDLDASGQHYDRYEEWLDAE